MVSVVKCYYNDSFSLEWCHHDGVYHLKVFFPDGGEDGVMVDPDMVKDLADLGRAIADE